MPIDEQDSDSQEESRFHLELRLRREWRQAMTDADRYFDLQQSAEERASAAMEKLRAIGVEIDTE